jgi:hypothetical protein
MFLAILYIFPFLVCCAKKNMATLNQKAEEDFNEQPFPSLPASLWRTFARTSNTKTIGQRTLQSHTPFTPLTRDQGDQVGRIFAYWAIVYFGQFLENHRSSPNSWLICFHGIKYVSF